MKAKIVYSISLLGCCTSCNTDELRLTNKDGYYWQVRVIKDCNKDFSRRVGRPLPRERWVFNDSLVDIYKRTRQGEYKHESYWRRDYEPDFSWHLKNDTLVLGEERYKVIKVNADSFLLDDHGANCKNNGLSNVLSFAKKRGTVDDTNRESSN